jgi:hypothetical protein
MMMKKEVRVVNSALELSGKWDSLADVYFKKKEFLNHTEIYNPCQQHYYELYTNEELSAGAIVYRLPLSYLAQKIGLKNPYKWIIIGVPASVSCSGLIGEKKSIDLLLKEIFKNEKGLILGININPDDQFEQVVVIESLPTIVMSHNFGTWQEYIAALRSDYRRRLKQITSSMKDIITEESDCSRYNEEMHALYMNILNKTKSKLETLSLDFFKNLPGRFRLTTYSHNGRIITWHVNLKDDAKLFFFFGGIDYELNEKFNSYFMNLSGIVKESIELGYKEIDFGQTAEIAKTRMGGVPVDKNMFVYHRTRLVRKIFLFCKRYFKFKRDIPNANVFK